MTEEEFNKLPKEVQTLIRKAYRSHRRSEKNIKFLKALLTPKATKG